MKFQFKHLDLNEIEGRLDPLGKKPSARGKMYWDTEPGRADTVAVLVAYILKRIWSKKPDQRVRIADIEADKHFTSGGGYSTQARVPAAVKRLDRMGQVKLDFDRDGVLIDRGPKWIET